MSTEIFNEFTELTERAFKKAGYNGVPTVGQSSPYTSVRREPYLDPPPGSQSFYPESSISIPAVGAGNVPVLSFIVPIGYDGAINAINNNFTGGGFVNGSGDLIWQILIDGRAVRNYDAILTERGLPGQAVDISPIQIFSGQLVEYVINHANNTLLANGYIICAVKGFNYPSRG